MRVANAYLIVGREAEALELALGVLTEEDGAYDLNVGNWGAIEICIWLLEEDDPRRQEMVGWMEAIIARFASQGFVGLGIWNARSVAAALLGDREAAIANMRETIARGGRRSRNYRNEPWWQQYHGDPEFDALLAELEAILTRQRNALRVEGL